MAEAVFVGQDDQSVYCKGANCTGCFTDLMDRPVHSEVLDDRVKEWRGNHADILEDIVTLTKEEVATVQALEDKTFNMIVCELHSYRDLQPEFAKAASTERATQIQSALFSGEQSDDIFHDGSSATPHAESCGIRHDSATEQILHESEWGNVLQLRGA